MISKSSEEYLKTMYILKQQNGNIRVTDIANKMNCTKPSVNKAVNNLKEEGLLNYESYGSIELTEKGIDLAKKILEALNNLNCDYDINKEKCRCCARRTAKVEKNCKE